MKRIMILPILFSFLLIGCSPNPAHSNHNSEIQHSESGDMQETTKGIDVLPSFLKNADPQIQAVYREAAKNADLLAKIPCYCGCGKSAGHKNNRDCFLREKRANGEIVWDSHGMTCGVCMEIAHTSVMLKQQGKSVKEIRQWIDQKYQHGYAEPTPTPQP